MNEHSVSGRRTASLSAGRPSGRAGDHAGGQALLFLVSVLAVAAVVDLYAGRYPGFGVFALPLRKRRRRALLLLRVAGVDVFPDAHSQHSSRSFTYSALHSRRRIHTSLVRLALECLNQRDKTCLYVSYPSKSGRADRQHARLTALGAGGSVDVVVERFPLPTALLLL